jgi:hypothetical protein
LKKLLLRVEEVDEEVVWKVVVEECLSGLFGCFGCLVAELCDDLVLVGCRRGLYTSLTMRCSYQVLIELEDYSGMLLRYALRCQNRSGSSCWRWSEDTQQASLRMPICYTRILLYWTTRVESTGNEIYISLLRESTSARMWSKIDR